MKRNKNEWRRRRPTTKEIRDAQKLARKVSKELAEMMEATANGTSDSSNRN